MREFKSAQDHETHPALHTHSSEQETPFKSKGRRVSGEKLEKES